MVDIGASVRPPDLSRIKDGASAMSSIISIRKGRSVHGRSILPNGNAIFARTHYSLPPLETSDVCDGCGTLAGVGLAQDPVKVDPKHHKVEFEDNQVRVLRITFPPGEKSVTHSHPNAVAVFLTESTLKQNVSAGNTSQGPRKAGDVVWAEPFTHTRKQAESGCPRKYPSSHSTI